MKLSVIIPVYNGADFIEKSYRSITNQNLEYFEIIYVNNNSSDGTRLQIQALIERDQRVILLEQPTQGTSYARNMGIRAAQGEYVYVFDVDDEIYPNALNKMISVLDLHQDVDAVFGKMVKSYHGISDTAKPQDETDEVILNPAPHWGLHWFSSLRNVVGPPAFLYRKKVFDKIGLYNENLKNDEDTALDIKLGMTCQVAFIDTYVYLYFKHQNSTIQQTKQKGGMIFHTWNRFTKEHLPFYLNNKVPFEFKEVLFMQLFSSLGKLVYYKTGYAKRKLQLKEILGDIKPIEVPFYIRFYLFILVLFPFKLALKFYVYYLSPWHVDRILKKETINNIE